ncbi:hypothetical protein MY11210_005578 [Beauveria gryllotalpidicola]
MTAATGAVTWRRRVGAGLPPDLPPAGRGGGGGGEPRGAQGGGLGFLFLLLLLHAAPPIPAKLLHTCERSGGD